MASRAHLCELCRKANLSVSGTKEDLLQRLVGSDAFMSAVKKAKKEKKETPAKVKVKAADVKDQKKPVAKSIAKSVGKGAVIKQPLEKKKSEYRVFCDANRAAVVAAGITRPADVMKKLAEMWGKGAKAKEKQQAAGEVFVADALIPDDVCRAAGIVMVVNTGSKFLYRKQIEDVTTAVPQQVAATVAPSYPPRVFAWKCIQCLNDLRVKLADSDPSKPIAFKTTCPSCSHAMHMTAPALA